MLFRSADGKLSAGCAGYFPEGVRYGPQTSDGDTWNLLLQFGGASGSGYMPEVDEDRGAAELKARGGRFEKGVYTWYRDDGTKVNQDAYEAIWEQVHGRPLQYPAARYQRPVMINSAHFDWRPDPTQPGVAHRLLGIFSEGMTKLSLIRIEAGNSLALEANSVWFVIKGDGVAGTQRYQAKTSLRTYRQETEAKINAHSETEMLQIRLPRI